MHHQNYVINVQAWGRLSEFTHLHPLTSLAYLKAIYVNRLEGRQARDRGSMPGTVKNFLFSNGAQSDCYTAARLQSNRQWGSFLRTTVNRVWDQSRIAKPRAKLLPQLCGFAPKTLNTVYLKLYLNVQSVPRRKHSVSVIQTSQLILYREIIAVCSQIHTKHVNTL